MAHKPFIPFPVHEQSFILVSIFVTAELKVFPFFLFISQIVSTFPSSWPTSLSLRPGGGRLFDPLTLTTCLRGSVDLPCRPLTPHQKTQSTSSKRRCTRSAAYSGKSQYHRIIFKFAGI